MPTSASNLGRGRKTSLPLCLPSNKPPWRDEGSSVTCQNTTIEKPISRFHFENHMEILMGALADCPHFLFILCLVFGLRIPLVCGQMRPYGNVFSTPCTSGMEGNLFTLPDYAYQVIIPSDRY